MSDDNITKLPIKYKAPPSDDGPMLKIVDRYDRNACNHSWQFVNGRQVNAQYLSSRGYEPGNVQVISNRANAMKHDATFEEFETMYLNWKKQRAAS